MSDQLLGRTVYYHAHRPTRNGIIIPAASPAIVTLVHDTVNKIMKDTGEYFVSLTVFEPSGISFHDCERAPHPGYDSDGYEMPQQFYFGAWSLRVPVLP